jgi:NAD(P)-dependent dehydrogenase (short-subunit alcohol dehydrogenase family)
MLNRFITSSSHTSLHTHTLFTCQRVRCLQHYLLHSGAARAGVENLTKTLALEWVSSNTRINSVAPGIIYTESGAKNYGASADELMPKLLQTIPARRCGTASEVSFAVVFLLSEGAAYITGTTVCVDGGSHMTCMTPLTSIQDKTNLSVYGQLDPKARL